ncbi:MAG: GNAT family N-acetyltransferase [Gammaproteobacteria bacterium]|nr:GNAT family N-acetyltransferase [Gammaproteobacteria bacterium]
MEPGAHLTETARTRIRAVTLSDADFILRLTQSDGWRRYIGDNKFTTTADAEKYIEEGFLKSYVVHGFGYYIVSDLAGNPMGIVGFLKKKYLNNPDFGFAFLPECHGHGYAMEAGLATFDYGVRRFMLSAVDAVTVPENRASIKLLEKLGFELVGDVKLPARDSSNRAAESLDLYRWLA